MASLLQVLRRKAGHLPRLLSTLGPAGTIAYSWRRLWPVPALPEPEPPPPPLPPPPPPKIDLLSFYRFLEEPVPALEGELEVAENTLTWVIPPFQLGSGGHLNIFRLAWLLEKHGLRQRMVIVGSTEFASGEQAREVIRQHFVPLEATVSLGEESLEPAEFTVATSWETAYPVRRFHRTRHKIYFIQDMEPYFFPVGSAYAFAEATYRFGFTAITAGDWLAKRMRDDYAMDAYPFGFSYEKERYRPHPRRETRRQVFFYARAVTPRRAFELGLLTLERIHRLLPDVRFVLAGWDSSNYLIPFDHVDAGVVALDDLAELYSQCDVALVLSMTNISLLPVELMASGCPLVSNDGPNVNWLLRNEETALLAEATPAALATAVVRVLEDDKLRQRLRDNALAFARSTDWAVEAERVHGYLQQIRDRHVVT